MGRIVFLVTSLVAINLAFLLFSCNIYDASGSCVPQSTIWSFVTNPSEINSANMWDILFGSASGLAAIAATIIFVGSFFMKVEFPLYASMSLALIYPVYSWIKLFTHIAGNKLFHSPVEAGIVAIMIASPIIITYIFTLLDWARGRD
jgi:hypothetical protein